MSYRIDTWDHPSAPKGGKRFSLHIEGEAGRLCKGVLCADGRAVVTAGHIPADAQDFVDKAAAEVAHAAEVEAVGPPPSAVAKMEALPKPELQAHAEAAGVPKSGTKAEIAERLGEATGADPKPTRGQLNGMTKAELLATGDRYGLALDKSATNDELRDDLAAFFGLDD